MFRFIGGALLFTLGVAAQQLTVSPSPIPGVELFAPESPEFDALVTQIVGPERPVIFAASLRYGVVIRNKTSQGIAAINTVWTAGDRVLLNAADDMFNKPVLYVKPEQTVLAVPPGIMQNARSLRVFAIGTTETLRMKDFDNPGKVTVVVDAVVFESGQFTGADQYGAFARWDAQIHAPRDLAASVLQRRETQSVGDIVVWIEGLAAAIRRAPPVDPHAQQTIFAAQVLLSVYRSKGEKELYSRAKITVDAPVFPLHR